MINKSDVVNGHCSRRRWRLSTTCVGIFFLVVANRSLSAEGDAVARAQIALGNQLFSDTALSRDGHTSCQNCHRPDHAFADTRPRSIGANQRIGTRNAPSLIGIGEETSFFWDGRRSNLEDAVLDPYTNAVELGLTSTDELLAKLKTRSALRERFRDAFPDAVDRPTLEQVRTALASFVRSLGTGNEGRDAAQAVPTSLSPEAIHGQRLFQGVAGCSECHTLTGNRPRLSDGQYHHSGISQAAQASQLPQLTLRVIHENWGESTLGQKVLTDPDWASLGRFVVSHQPADIGAFRTPSLRNVAVTAPYMHDGSVATLSAAVDQEVYYRGFSSGHPINLTQSERHAIVAFLESMTDANYQSAPTKDP